jgi:pimeloyl-ACP methyl ester carboxylesterase
MPNVKVNDIHIDYESTGAGHPLVLIAPLAYGRWFWRKIVPPLAEHFRVITFDNRGTGDSDKPDGPLMGRIASLCWRRTPWVY